MSFDSYVHRARPGAPGAPILFTFHGTGGDENQFFDFASRLVPGATIISPRGDVAEHGAARFFRRKAEGVYDLDDLARATKRMSEFVEANRDRYESSTVLGLGFSNGANILANVMIERPGLKKRAAPCPATSPRGEMIVAPGTSRLAKSKNWFSSPPVPWKVNRIGAPGAPGRARCT